jgi:hypothetical protein
MITYNLHAVPADSLSNKIDASPVIMDGRSVMRITLDAASRAGKFGIDFVDKPSFLLLPDVLADACIKVDILARMLPDAPDYARGFIGLAFRVQPDLYAYESVYLRPANGMRHAPEPPRGQRAVQYYAYPDWPFDILREHEPGRFEAPADIGLNTWHELEVNFTGTGYSVSVDGAPVLQGQGKLSPQPGKVGLWVDIGTEGFFANLRMAGT